MRWFVVFAVTVATGFIAYAGIDIADMRERRLTELRAAAGGAVAGLEDSANLRLRAVRGLIGTIAEDLAFEESWLFINLNELSQRTERSRRIAPEVQSLGVYNRDGRAALSFGTMPDSAAGWPLFEAHRLGGTGFRVDPPPRGADIPGASIVASIPVRSADGRFLGVVAAILPQTAVLAADSEAKMRAGAAGTAMPTLISRLMHRDGALVAALPSAMAAADRRALVEATAEAPAGVIEDTLQGSDGDSVAVITAWRALSAEFDLVLAVSIPVAGALSGWKDYAFAYGSAALALSLVVGVLGLVAVRQTVARERDLSESEARMRGLLEACPAGAALIDKEGRWRFANRRHAEILGCADVEAALALSPAALAEDQASARQAIATAFAGSVVSNVTVARRRQDTGARVFTVCDFEPIPYAGETMVLMWSYDVTVKETAQRALEGERRFLAAILDALPLPVHVRGPDGRYILANQAYGRAVGADPARLIGTNPKAHLRPEIVAQIEEDERLIEETGRAVVAEWQWINNVGEVRDAIRTRAPIRDPEGGLIGIVSAFVDITQNKRTERALRSSEQRLKALFDKSGDPILVHSASLRIVEANEAACAAAGLPREKLLAQRLTAFVLEPDEAVIAGQIAALQPGIPSRPLRGRFAAADGRAMAVEARLTRLSLDGQDTVISVFRDMSERERAEEEIRAARNRAEEALRELERAHVSLVQAEKLAGMGALVAGVAHELNTPVGIALTAASHLEDEARTLTRLYDAGDLSAEDFETFIASLSRGTALVLSNCRRAADLVRSFKRLAVDRDAEEESRFDLADLVEDVAHGLGPSFVDRGIRLDLDVAPGIVLTGYPAALSQVLSGLCLNALSHAFPEAGGGRVSIMAAENGDGTVVVRIADSGVGIAASIMDRVFDPFFTTRRDAGHVGLGLHLAFNTVTGLMGGSLTLESAVGTGTTAVILLPRQAPGARQERPA